MSQSRIPAFDSTVQTTNVWLNEIQERLGWADKQLAYHALRAVLHALRDRLGVEQVAALCAQLPMLVRGFYYEGWHPAGKPFRERKKEEFLTQIRQDFREELSANAEETARAVFQVLAKHVSPGEVKHVKITLPEDIRSLWSRDSHTAWF